MAAGRMRHDVLLVFCIPPVFVAIVMGFAVTGLTHRQSYGDIFAITLISTLSVFLVIGVYYLTGLV